MLTAKQVQRELYPKKALAQDFQRLAIGKHALKNVTFISIFIPIHDFQKRT